MSKRRRIAPHMRKPSVLQNARYDAAYARYLEMAERLFEEGKFLDTSVRDTLSDGIVRVLWVAFDCRACALNLANTEFNDFVSVSTSSWLRAKGFAEWYCKGAETLFHTTHLPTVVFNTRIVKAAKKGTKRK